jgi:hypothetical protein
VLFWAFKEAFQKRSRSLNEAESTKENHSISHSALIGFAWNIAASTGVDVGVFEPTGIYPLNRNRVPEYFFSIYQTNETATFMKTAPPDMAPICASSTSGTNCQNVLPISAGPSLNTLNTTLPSDTSPKDVTSFKLLEY